MDFKKFVKDKKVLIKLIIIVAFLLLDILSKVFFARFFTIGNEEFTILFGLIEFTYLENTGAAFGSFSNGTIWLAVISAVFVVAIIVFDVLYVKKETTLYSFAFSLVVSGAIGNLIDRVFLHYVRDFIKFSMFDFVCNIADICICVGVVLFVINMIIIEHKKRKEQDNNVE